MQLRGGCHSIRRSEVEIRSAKELYAYLTNKSFQYPFSSSRIFFLNRAAAISMRRVSRKSKRSRIDSRSETSIGMPMADNRKIRTIQPTSETCQEASQQARLQAGLINVDEKLRGSVSTGDTIPELFHIASSNLKLASRFTPAVRLVSRYVARKPTRDPFADRCSYRESSRSILDGRSMAFRRNSRRQNTLDHRCLFYRYSNGILFPRNRKCTSTRQLPRICINIAALWKRADTCQW